MLGAIRSLTQTRSAASRQLCSIASGLLKSHLRAARAAGRTILISSHILVELEELADDVAFLCDGQLRFAGPVDTLLRETGTRRLEPAVAALLRGLGIA